MGAVGWIRSAHSNMKFLIISCFVAASLARPSGPDHQKEEEHGDKFVVRACLTENWKEDADFKQNMDNVMTCIKCFTKIEDYESQSGVDSAKACVSQHLPWEQEACQSELDALTADNEESGEAVIECMEDWQYMALSEWCLGRSESTESLEKLTDGTMCILESIKNVTLFSNYVNHMDGRRQPKKFKKLQNGGGRKNNPLKNYVMHKLLPAATCEAANMDDQARLDECKQCFESVTKENHKTKVYECTSDFLMPYYQECEESMNSLNENSSKEEKKDVKKCFFRGVIKSVVMRVSPDTEATPENLLETFEEGHDFVIDWVQNNARPEFAKKIIKFLDDDDEDEFEDDDE